MEPCVVHTWALRPAIYGRSARLLRRRRLRHRSVVRDRRWLAGHPRAGRVNHMGSQEPDMAGSELVGVLGRGMVAGAVGTVAMTVSERFEMAVTGREGSQGSRRGGSEPAAGEAQGVRLGRRTAEQRGALGSRHHHGRVAWGPSTSLACADPKPAWRISRSCGTATQPSTAPWELPTCRGAGLPPSSRPTCSTKGCMPRSQGRSTTRCHHRHKAPTD